MLKHTTFALAIALSLAACSSDKSNEDSSTPEPAGEPAPSAPAPAEPAPEPAVDDKPIPLLAWVDDLIDHHTSDESLPDTVDDKNIEPNEDPAAFDKYLQ